jgi:hypothetical protein
VVKYAVYKTGEHWLVDTSVGGTYSPNVDDAKWWTDPAEALNELRACDLVDPWKDAAAFGFQVIRVR